MGYRYDRKFVKYFKNGSIKHKAIYQNRKIIQQYFYEEKKRRLFKIPSKFISKCRKPILTFILLRVSKKNRYSPTFKNNTINHGNT